MVLLEQKRLKGHHQVCCDRCRGPRTSLKTTDTSLDCVFLRLKFLAIPQASAFRSWVRWATAIPSQPTNFFRPGPRRWKDWRFQRRLQRGERSWCHWSYPTGLYFLQDIQLKPQIWGLTFDFFCPSYCKFNRWQFQFRTYASLITEGTKNSYFIFSAYRENQSP